MRRLAVVAMTEILHYWLAGNLHFHSTAGTLYRGNDHDFRLVLGVQKYILISASQKRSLILC